MSSYFDTKLVSFSLLPFTSVITRRILNRNFMIMVCMWPRSSIFCFRQRDARTSAVQKLSVGELRARFLPSLCGCYDGDDKFCKPVVGWGCEVRRSFNLVRPQQRLSEEKEKSFFFQSRKLSYDATTRTKFNVPPSLYHRRPLTMSRLAVLLKS